MNARALHANSNIETLPLRAAQAEIGFSRYFRGPDAPPVGKPRAPHAAEACVDVTTEPVAEYWTERTIALAPAGFTSNLTMQMFQLYRGDPAAALEYGRRAFEIKHYWAYDFSSLDPVEYTRSIPGQRSA